MKTLIAITSLLTLSSTAALSQSDDAAKAREQRIQAYSDQYMDKWEHRHDNPAKPAKPAPDREVRVFFAGSTQRVTGDTIPEASILVLLFTKEVCPLDVENARNLYRAWQRGSAYQLGCWFPVQGSTHWAFIGQLEGMNRIDRGAWQTYPRALLHADGSATIIEPHYDSTTAMRDFISDQMRHAHDHDNDKP